MVRWWEINTKYFKIWAHFDYWGVMPKTFDVGVSILRYKRNALFLLSKNELSLFWLFRLEHRKIKNIIRHWITMRLNGLRAKQ